MNEKAYIGIGVGIAAGVTAIILARKFSVQPKPEITLPVGLIPTSKINSPYLTEGNFEFTAVGAYNNPGNIRKSSIVYDNEIGFDDSPFKSFASMPDGYHAMMQLFKHYYNSGYTTLSKIINHYAPPTENNTVKYIQDVSADLNFSPDQDAHDLIFSDNITGLLSSFTRKEQGANFYIDPTDLNLAYQLA